jgi:hypothetical protein
MTIETKFIYLQKQYMIKKGSNFESGLKNNTFSFNKNVLHIEIEIISKHVTIFSHPNVQP